MMVKLFRSVRGLVKQELNLANRQNGDRFHSVHEGYGVILEELSEGLDEVRSVTSCADLMMDCIRKNDRSALMGCTKDIERRAMLAASEFIQVAAMARKLIESERVKYSEQNG